MHFLLPTIFLFFASVSVLAINVQDTSEWKQALDLTFLSKSKASKVSEDRACNLNVKHMLLRQDMPVNVTWVRSLDDIHLYRILFLAGIAGISPWVRDDETGLLLLDENGHLTHISSPSLIESDIMICIICSLLIVIATFHLTSHQNLSSSSSVKTKFLPDQNQNQHITTPINLNVVSKPSAFNLSSGKR
jgi:hypothetical protein